MPFMNWNIQSYLVNVSLRLFLQYQGQTPELRDIYYIYQSSMRLIQPDCMPLF